jgi:hypothetical protein
MDRLNETIAQYSHWKSLSEYTNRIQAYKESDFPLCIENAKSLLESIAKEICVQRGQSYSDKDSTGKILKTAFAGLGYGDEAKLQQVARAISHIGSQMGLLRNKVGATSHGRTLEELEKRRSLIDKTSCDFLIMSTELVCCLLIQLFESNAPPKMPELEMLSYEENPDFNDSLDSEQGEFMIGSLTFLPSEILYRMDPLAYKEELAVYKKTINEADN